MKCETKPRFFIGLAPIGDLNYRLSQGLRELGYEVTNVVVSTDNPWWPNRKCDRYIRGPSKPIFCICDLVKEFVKNFYSHDIFVFIGAYSFLAYIDLPLLKMLGKKIIVFVTGSDLRSYNLLVKELKNDGLYSHAKYLEKDLAEITSSIGTIDFVQMLKAKIIGRYADQIFAQPHMTQFLSRNYDFLWVSINLDEVEYKVSESDEPLIIHAPTRRSLKGTKYVLPVIQELREEGHRFRFMLCEKMPNEELRKRLADSEIVIDQLLMPSHGLFGVEAMATGNVVLGSAVPGYNGFPKDLPIVTTMPDNLYENLKMMLDNPELRVKLARRGRKYVEKYHDSRKVTRFFLNKIGIVE